MDLLRRLMATESMQEFYLVGGTALALRYGHRTSVDLDLFTSNPFDSQALAECLVRQFALQELTIHENTVSGVIGTIKVDCLAHRYPLLFAVEEVDGIRLLASPDIGAMKLNAISNRGSKKDFWDYHELLKHFKREDLLSFYEKKYPHGSTWSLEKSLVYFDDAELEPDPLSLKGESWADVRSAILRSNRWS